MLEITYTIFCTYGWRKSGEKGEFGVGHKFSMSVSSGASYVPVTTQLWQYKDVTLQFFFFCIIPEKSINFGNIV
jgi:hypothetical protein